MRQPARARTAKSRKTRSPARAVTAVKGVATGFAELKATAPAPPGRGEAAWQKGFPAYVFHLIAPLYGPAGIETAKRIASGPQTIDVFRRAFTDETYSADSYQTLEKIGDKVLALVFDQYLYERLGADVTPQQLTNYAVAYMSKRFQAELATDMGMHNWILVGEPVANAGALTKSVREDVFEAFASALMFAANLEHAAALRDRDYERAAVAAPPGTEIALRLMHFIFSEVGIDPKKALDNAKTRLKSIGTLFGVRESDIQFQSRNGKFSVFVPQALRNILTEYGIDLPAFLARDFDEEMDAAVSAREIADAAGLTDEFIETQRYLTQGRMLSENLRQRLDMAVKKAGYVKYLFRKPEAHTREDGTHAVILTAIDESGSHRQVAVATGKRDSELYEKAALSFVREIGL